MSVIAPVADLLAAPDQGRDRQLKFGETFQVLETRDGVAFGYAERDGYCGYVAAEGLGAAISPTHRICATSSHVYTRADMKSPDRLALPLGALVEVLEPGEKFAQTDQGFIPTPHLEPIETRHELIPAARKYLGSPYLWGGNSIWGIDCSGLVQAAHEAAGVSCPADSDQQMAALRSKINPASQPVPGELFFWKGHVALVEDETTFIHANAFHMAVVRENIDAAIARIAAQGDGAVIARGRIT